MMASSFALVLAPETQDTLSQYQFMGNKKISKS